MFTKMSRLSGNGSSTVGFAITNEQHSFCLIGIQVAHRAEIQVNTVGLPVQCGSKMGKIKVVLNIVVVVCEEPNGPGAWLLSINAADSSCNSKDISLALFLGCIGQTRSLA